MTLAKRGKPQSLTDLPPSAQDDRRSRMIKYSIAMGIRTLCVISLVFLSGWWMAVALVGAIVLPYIAVVIANVSMRPMTTGADRPGTLVPVSVPVRIMDDDADDPFGPRMRDQQDEEPRAS